MAIDYSKIFLNIDRHPAPPRILIAIPMYLYRVETNEFSHGLNFFQITILKFKAKSGINNEDIARYTGLDDKLISIVEAELEQKKLINRHGSITEEGKEKLQEVDGIIIDPSKKKIGYILQYLDKDEFYPFYVEKIIPADTISENENHPKIIIGAKENGSDYTETPYYFDELYKARQLQPKPSARDAISLIENTNKKNSFINNESENYIERLSNKLSVRFISKTPDIVWVSTYIYLEERENGIYEPDWRVVDPFESKIKDNINLKFYLQNNSSNKKILQIINEKFGGLRTTNNKIFSDYHSEVSKIVENKIKDYSIGFYKLDKNLQEYIRGIERNIFKLRQHNYSDLDASLSFSMYLQNTLENMLKLDKEKRFRYYKDVYRNYNDKSTRAKVLENIWKKHLFSNNIIVPKPLLNVIKKNLEYSSSLKGYLASFILTYEFNSDSILFKVFENRIELIVEIAQLRNEKGHGQTEKEKPLKPLSKEKVEKYYKFIKSLIRDYIQG